MTYEATVTAPAWATVLMSALQDVSKDKNAKCVHASFRLLPCPYHVLCMCLELGRGDCDHNSIQSIE